MSEGERAIEAAAGVIRQWARSASGMPAEQVAKRALRAYLAALPAWRLAPEEPTERMLADGVISLIDNGLDGLDGVGHSDAQRCWANMLEAATEDTPPPGLED